MIRKIELPHARLKDLKNIHQLLDDLCQHEQLDDSTCYAVRLSVEEAYVNIVDHGYTQKNPGPVSVTIKSNPDQIIAIVTDRAPPFAPQGAPDPDLDLDWDERRIGGLGWHFIREMMDEIRYESDDAGNNWLTLVKSLHPASRAGGRRERLEITVSSRGNATIVALGGTINALTAKSASEILKKQVIEGKTRLIVDLERVTFMSSAGVYTLLQALKEARAHSGDLCVTNVSKEVRKVLDLSGFSKICKFYLDVNSAVASFSG